MEILIFDAHRQLCAIRLLIFIGKNIGWHRLVGANKKQAPLKSYSLKVRVDSVNQILKNKQKVTATHNINILTRITDQNIPCVYIHVYQITKNWAPGPYNSVSQADNRKIFWVSPNAKSKGTAHILLDNGSGKNLQMFLLRKGNFIMINEFKPEKFDHLYLVHHFTVPLNIYFWKSL